MERSFRERTGPRLDQLSRRVVEQRDGLPQESKSVADRGRRIVGVRAGSAELAHERARRTALDEDIDPDETDPVAVRLVRRGDERGLVPA